MRNEFNRRGVLVAGAAFGLTLGFPRSARALNLQQARALIDHVIDEVNGIINSGKSEAAMIREFERVFATYADVSTIARSALGPAARQATSQQLNDYTQAFRGYMARKYGKRFREFIGGRIEVTTARPVRTYFEVVSIAYLQGEAPFEVRWLVSDRSGRDLFFNMFIEGVNLLATERTEIGAMLDKRRGDISAMTQDLKRAG